LDDLGSDAPPPKAIFALPYPLTISVLPNHDHSTKLRRSGSPGLPGDAASADAIHRE